MNKRIKVYTFALTIVYSFMLVFYIVSAIKPFMVSLERGVASMESRAAGGMESTFHLEVKPKLGAYTFPTPIVNSGEFTSSSLEMGDIKVRKFVGDENMSSNYMVFFGAKTLFAITLLVFFLYAPFLFFKIVRAVTKGNMFDISVLGKMNKIGWGIVILYSVAQFIRVGEVYFNSQLIDIEGYEIVYTMPNFTPFILGLVILFLAEVLRIGLFMKEEQDLTI